MNVFPILSTNKMATLSISFKYLSQPAFANWDSFVSFVYSSQVCFSVWTCNHHLADTRYKFTLQ